MGERFYFCGINIAGDIFGLCFLCKHNRNIKNFSHNTGNSDSRCLDGQDFRDLLSRKTTLKLFSDFPEIQKLQLSITKVNPPMGADSDGAGVEVVLTNDKTYS